MTNEWIKELKEHYCGVPKYTCKYCKEGWSIYIEDIEKHFKRVHKGKIKKCRN